MTAWFMNARADSFSAFCAEAHDLESGAMYFLGELVDGNVRGCAHEHLVLALALIRVEFGEMVDDCGTRDCFSRAGRPL